ncbi:hypothetical protein COMA2_160054 [Candidatus Nitrospira nitrificans]|uniref:Uncharacterized protein n=1 Tax=Candidatus Nitrospira nitrificans TaxID=1742973 RepID=A0A0S4LEB9_9BACT|nr:hypothetical protein COMA2_160054 [Candidatus Nitrospira nitrificans]
MQSNRSQLKGRSLLKMVLGLDTELLSYLVFVLGKAPLLEPVQS